MKWVKCTDEFPPIGKKILVLDRHACWHMLELYRPFDKDDRYNPDYYEFKDFDRPKKFSVVQYPFWMEVVLPCQWVTSG